VLTEAPARDYLDGNQELLDAYSAICLDRIWKVQRFFLVE
jgi:hypothetical protein